MPELKVDSSPSVSADDLFRVGVITNTHGVRGEVKVYPTTDDKNRYKKLKKVILSTEDSESGDLTELEIASVRFFKNLCIVKFKDIDNINDIEKYKGYDIYVTRENAVPLGEDEYFYADIIGAKVYTEENEYFGELTDVMQTGANDVYCVMHEGREVLLPVIPECVKDIDTDNKTVTVHIMKGLV